MKKTAKQLIRHIEYSHKFKWECIRRNPDYRKDYEKFKSFYEQWDKEQNTKKRKILEQKTFGFEEEIKRKYKLLFVENPDDPNGWIAASGKFVVKFIWATDYGKNWSDLVKKQPDQVIRHILRDSRYLRIEIDTHRDKEIIFHEIAKKINFIKQAKKKYGLECRVDRAPHLDKFGRYIKVFDFRNQKPPCPYQKIALSLIGAGLYKSKTLEPAVSMAKKDFAVAFKEIYKIPYEQHGKSKFRKSDFRGCRDCNARHVCKDLCSEAEYYLFTEVEKKRTEALFDKGVIDIMPPDVLKRKKRKAATKPEDEENRAIYMKTSNRKKRQEDGQSKVDHDTERWLRGKDI